MIKFSENTVAHASSFAPLGFLRKYSNLLGNEVLNGLAKAVAAGQALHWVSEDGSVDIVYRALPWDTQYFGIETFRIDFLNTGLEGEHAVMAYRAALKTLAQQIAATHPAFYIFAELPSTSLQALQGAGMAEWRLIETRLTYYHDKLQSYEYPKRFLVRDATPEDSENLQAVGRKCRNEYDRFHADFTFSPAIADDFIATFIKNSITGYADITLVPNPDENPPAAFLTANYLPNIQEPTDRKMAKMVLSAVDESRRGWYVRLISEMSYRFKEAGVDLAFMTTQSTNRAVIKTWESLGYSYGKSSHVFAFLQR